MGSKNGNGHAKRVVGENGLQRLGRLIKELDAKLYTDGSDDELIVVIRADNSGTVYVGANGRPCMRMYDFNSLESLEHWLSATDSNRLLLTASQAL